MLKLSIVFAALVALAASGTVPSWGEKKIADKDYLMKQKAVLQLLVHIQQPLLYPNLIEISKNYKIEDHIDMYLEKKSVEKFLKLWKEDILLKKGEVFTPLDDWHLKQSIYLFEVFYFAKDWDTMYKTAVWARENVNEGLFAYALTTALRHHPTTKNLVIPRLSEIVPHMFVRSETIQKAYETRMRTIEKTDKDIVVIPSNFSEWLHPKMTPEMRMVYFTEDVALNEWNLDMNMDYPWWMMANPKRYNIEANKYGELMYYKQKQLLNRYKLERLTNNLEEMTEFKWTTEKMVGFAPHLRYKNGMEMPMRPENVKLVNTEEVEIETIKRLEERLQKAIDTGYIMNAAGIAVPISAKDGVDTISRIIDQGMEGVNPKIYGSLLRKMLVLVGRIADPMHKHGLAPGALMHWETQLRDPMYYSILARVHELYRKQKDLVYTKNDLLLPGVTIESMELDKLITFFEAYDVEINNAVDVTSLDDDKKVTIVARESRINYKPFNFRAMINSEKEMSVIVRLFLGPKRDANGLELNLHEKAPHMFEFDRFAVDLTAGKNKVERNSKDFAFVGEDKTTFRTLYKKIEDAIQGKNAFYIEQKDVMTLFPAHLMFPKGKKNGMPYTVFMTVTPHEEKNFVETDKIVLDRLPLGFPFDREVYMEDWHVPNMMEKEVLIYHKKTDEKHESL